MLGPLEICAVDRPGLVLEPAVTKTGSPPISVSWAMSAWGRTQGLSVAAPDHGAMRGAQLMRDDRGYAPIMRPRA